MKTLLITGGNGFIARNIAPLFALDGWEVHTPSHSSMDLLKWDSLVEYFELNDYCFDAVIHAAVKGGMRGRSDTLDDLSANMKMFENLMQLVDKKTPVIIYGSGAEYDRRSAIDCATEHEVWTSWPIDPYGLSKNLITRRALTEYNNIRVLRLFGCFHPDEPDTRFIKRSILRLKQGLPIEIHKNKDMDFFSLEDVFTVTKYAIQETQRQTHLNLVYQEKMDLLNIASLIHKHTGIFEPTVSLQELGKDNPYTGDGIGLRFCGLKLDGLENGIERMSKALL